MRLLERRGLNDAHRDTDTAEQRDILSKLVPFVSTYVSSATEALSRAGSGRFLEVAGSFLVSLRWTSQLLLHWSIPLKNLFPFLCMEPISNLILRTPPPIYDGPKVTRRTHYRDVVPEDAKTIHPDNKSNFPYHLDSIMNWGDRSKSADTTVCGATFELGLFRIH